MISLIVACGQNNVIGVDGGMPWHLPADLKHFKSLTMGKPIVMGRKTYQSIGKPLPGRTNIVITRDPDFHAEGLEITHSLGQALETAAAFGEEVMVIGGGQIYQAALPFAERIYLTRVEQKPDGNVLFPNIDEAQWTVTTLEGHAAAGDQPAFTFVRLDRRT